MVLFKKSTLKKIPWIVTSYKYFIMILTALSPKLATMVLYRVARGEPINLTTPRTLNEKISWLKLNTYYKNPLVSKCADKYAVREYIVEQGCGEILNELYGVYENPEEIQWEKLPEKFVLKWNMGCGCNIICHDKSRLDIQETKNQLKTWGKIKYHLLCAEMQYKDIPRKIICEKLLQEPNALLPVDYKFYCFNGKALYVMVCVGREKGHPKFYYFDRNWELARLSQDSIDAPEGFSLEKPEGIEKAFEYAEILSKPFPFVRADFYIINGQPYFGELTFTPSGGIDSERLKKTEELFGSLLDLSPYLTL